MFARVNRFQDSPDNVSESERIVEQEVIPRMQEVAGFLGVLSLVNRATGESLGITFWESEEAMTASESAADSIRSELRDRTGTETRNVERYEVSLRVGI